LPEGAWDTHFHALGPQSRFPYSPKRKYTPPDAPLEACLALHHRLGISRGLVVHANTHGFDNSVDLDAVARSGGRYFAVVRLDATATRERCMGLLAAGARGVRFAFNPQHGGTLDRDAFEHVLKCIEGLGWFVELHFEGTELPGLRPWLESIPATVVIDHMGRVDPAAPDQVSALLAVAMRENVWIKISGLERLSKRGAPYADVRPLVESLAKAVPDRLMWGSDWPHTGFFDAARIPDDGVLVDAFVDCVPDESLRCRILVDNPERLLGLGHKKEGRYAS
jgi:predicted TIM-barrel fold metal-dependent hydrolase